jgi:CheY-like chemotaxis protein
LQQRPETRATLDGARILVLDDEPDARALLEAVLSEAAAVVETRSTVRDALAAVDAFHPDVVVCDIGLPEEDGYVFVGKLRARPGRLGASLPVIALTAYARPEDRRSTVTAGFNAHISKPVDGDELIAVISNLYRMGQDSRQ